MEIDSIIPLKQCEYYDYNGLMDKWVQQHKRDKHGMEWYYCDECNYKGKELYHLIQHWYSKHDLDMYFCNECKYKTKTEKRYKRHMRRKHSLSIYFNNLNITDDTMEDMNIDLNNLNIV